MATKKTEPKPKKVVVAWGMKGSNGLIHTITNKEFNAIAWRNAGADVRELVENDDAS